MSHLHGERFLPTELNPKPAIFLMRIRCGVPDILNDLEAGELGVTDSPGGFMTQPFMVHL